MKWQMGGVLAMAALATVWLAWWGAASRAAGGPVPAQTTPQPPGGTWSTVHAPAVAPLWGNNPPTLRGVHVIETPAGYLGYAVGDSGAMARFEGGKWRVLDDLDPRKTTPLTYHLNDVFVIAANDVWAVGAMDGDRMCRDERCGALFHYDGRAWRVIDKTSYGLPGRVPPMRAIDMLADAEGNWFGWIVGDDLLTDTLKALIMRFQDGKWRVWTGPNNFARHLHDVKLISRSEAWLVGEAGVESWYTENAAGVGSWAPLGKSGADDLYALDLADPLYGWDGGATGRMNRYKGHCHDEDPNSQCWFDNQSRPIRASPDAPQALNPTVWDIDMLSREEAWLVGAAASRRSTVAYLDPVREMWYMVSIAGDPGVSLMALHMASTLRGWAVGEKGVILAYVDEAAPTPTTAPTDPPTASPSATPTSPPESTAPPTAGPISPSPTPTETEAATPTATDVAASATVPPSSTAIATTPGVPTLVPSATSTPADKADGRLYLPFTFKPRSAGR